MSWVIYLFGSGAAFFMGIGLILAALGCFTFFQRRLSRGLASLLALVGFLLVALSSTPLPYWFYAIAGATVFVWLLAERQGQVTARRRWLRGLVVALCAAAIGLECPYHFVPTIPDGGNPSLYIIGDSVSAGMGGEKETWPRILARTRPVEVVDLARAGATAASALRQAENLPEDGGLVLLEIGGNDVLGSTSAAKFQRDLSQLFHRVCVPGRTVLMFELPLPPFCNEYGRIQRQLAASHGVVLVPKRVFAAVLTGEEATLDSVHLDRAGHERMAEVVWSLIRPAYRE